MVALALVQAFKHAIAIAKLTIGVTKFTMFARARIDRGDAIEQVARFNAIRTDVLHGCGTNKSGDQRKVFQPAQTFRQCPQHKRMPRLTGHRFHQHGVAFVEYDTRTAQCDLQHRGLDVLCQ